MALVSMNHTHTTSRHVQYKTFHNNNNRACLVPCWCRVDSRGRHSRHSSFVTAIHALFINLANRVCPFFFEGAIISHFSLGAFNYQVTLTCQRKGLFYCSILSVQASTSHSSESDVPMSPLSVRIDLCSRDFARGNALLCGQ